MGSIKKVITEEANDTASHCQALPLITPLSMESTKNGRGAAGFDFGSLPTLPVEAGEQSS